MYKNKLISRIFSSLLTTSFLVLSGCGGGGASGGNPTINPTPPPPPPPPPKSFREVKEDFTFLAPIGAAIAVFSDRNGNRVRDTIKKISNDSTLDFGEKSGNFDLDFLEFIGGSGVVGRFRESFTKDDLVESRSDNIFSVFKTSDAEFALLNPGSAASGYDYTSLILVIDNNTGGNQGFSADIGLISVVFGFPTLPDTLPTTGQAEFRGGIVGNAAFSNGDFGVLNGPVLINVDFVENKINGVFGGITSSQVLGSLKFTSFVGGVSGDLPDIRFTAPLDRATGLFSADIRFASPTPLTLDPILIANPGGRVEGGFFGLSDMNGPPEIGGTLQVNNDLLMINAAFIARQGGAAESFNFDGIKPQLSNFDTIRPYPVTGIASASVNDNFIVTYANSNEINGQRFANHTIPFLPGEFLFPEQFSDFNSFYRSDLSGADALTFELFDDRNFDNNRFFRISLDTVDANRFDLEEVRFGFAANFSFKDSFFETSSSPYFTTSLISLDYFIFGSIAQPTDLPLTGLAQFEGDAFGQYYIFSPLENGPALNQQYFDFNSKVSIDLNFATGLTEVTFSNYTIPTALLDYIDVGARGNFSISSGFVGSLNFFDSNSVEIPFDPLGSFQGHLFQTELGDLELGGKFNYSFGKVGNNFANAPELRITGAFGASLISIENTGEPSRSASGIAVDLVNTLMTVTDPFTGQSTDQFAHLTSLVSGNPGQVERIFSYFGTYKRAGTSGSLAVLSPFDELNRLTSFRGYANITRSGPSVFMDFSSADITRNAVDAFSGGTTIAERITITAEVLSNASGNASFTLISEKTATGGDELLALSRPGSDVFGLDYAGFGIWALEDPSGAFRTNTFVYGTSTPESDIPATGTANYQGKAIGIATQGPGSASSKNITVGVVTGDSLLNVDFLASTVSLTIDNLDLTLSGESGTMSLSPITGIGQINGSSFSGQFDGSTGNGLDFIGSFFGLAAPLPPEVAGLWNKRIIDPRNASDFININGVFTGKAQ